jgi:ubiquinone/menaquinone biosynthesis C-methylase UbiE
VNQTSVVSEAGDAGSAKYNTACPVAPVLVSTEDGYERWAPTYDEDPNPLLHLEERKLAAFLPSLSGRSVLDLACGTGRWLEKLSRESTRLGVGVDLSTAMLRVADRKAGISGRLARADCQRLPFQASTFDLVICSFALGHIRDLGATLCEMARVTRAGADVFVTDLHPEAYARGWRTGFRDSGGGVEIEMSPRTAEEVIRSFYGGGFECLTHVPLCLGEPEKPIFVRAGKGDLFAPACQVPAVLVCHFRRPTIRQENQMR